MSLTAVRLSLAAAVITALLITLFPPTLAQSGTTQAQNTTQRVRRGKNGEAVKPPDSQDSTGDERSAQNSTPDSNQGTNAESSKPASNDKSTNQQPTKSSKPTAQPASESTTDPLRDSGEPRHERDAPAFDRPPLRGQGHRVGTTRDVNPDSAPQTSSQRPTYSSNEPARQRDSRQYPQYPQDRSTSTSTGADSGATADPSATGSTDPARTNRSGGSPPVLRRPADSRNDGPTQSSRPPVLRRPSDSQPADDSGSQDVKAGKPYPNQQGSGSQQQQSGEDEVVKLESTLVSIPLLVSDRSGRYIPQLRANDFLLFEDGVQQKIESFGSEEVPFSVVLLLDVSPSVSGSIKEIQDAAIAFVHQLRNQDRVMVVSFDRNIHYLSEFTSDRRELEWAIRRASMGGGTSVYDAVYETVDRKLRNVEGRKALILFSDGDDTTSSRASYDDAVNLVSESDVLVYGLRYPGSGGGGGGGGRGGISWPRNQIPRMPFPFPFPWPTPRRRGPFNMTGSAPSTNGSGTSAAAQSWPRRRGGGGDFMKDITAAGGGPVYDAERISDMSTVANKIAEELRHVYVISYYPTNPLSKGGYRKVRVSVRNRDDIAVRHRPGYNARPNGSARPTI
jgi:Ca-activated chloride channel family protein